jgi:hypothetical protein
MFAAVHKAFIASLPTELTEKELKNHNLSQLSLTRQKGNKTQTVQ